MSVRLGTYTREHSQSTRPVNAGKGKRKGRVLI